MFPGGRRQPGWSHPGLRCLRAEEHAGPRQLHHREGEGPGEQRGGPADQTESPGEGSHWSSYYITALSLVEMFP